MKINKANDEDALFVCENSNCPVNIAKSGIGKNEKHKERRSLIIK
ncbi:hypothetical protein CLOSBL3_10563 [Clostridiaceae bacterium BL-3]|nr:hypothetical protein CLOSBL3_10563 [Clostridiaceae bacterium BL-3]